MSGMNMLDLFVGLISIYLVFGIVCTAIVEWVNQFLNLRSNNLEAALREMFSGELSDQQSFVDAFYAHPLIRSLCSKDRKGNLHKPSYIPPALVGRVVESLLIANQAAKGAGSMTDALPGTPDGNQLKAVVASYVDEAKGDAEAFRKSVSVHFDMVMDRASGWFKRKTQVAAFYSAAVLVLVGNVDTLQIAQTLANNPAVRAEMVALANQLNTNGMADDAGVQASFEQARQAFESSTLRFGWHLPSANEGAKSVWEHLLDGLAKVLGLLISIMAISLGAPFWFDTLQRVTKLRTSASPRDAKQSETTT
jgi:hypothetical protein